MTSSHTSCGVVAAASDVDNGTGKLRGQFIWPGNYLSFTTPLSLRMPFFPCRSRTVDGAGTELGAQICGHSSASFRRDKNKRLAHSDVRDG